jgi:hypothetical protein
MEIYGTYFSTSSFVIYIGKHHHHHYIKVYKGFRLGVLKTLKGSDEGGEDINEDEDESLQLQVNRRIYD